MTKVYNGDSEVEPKQELEISTVTDTKNLPCFGVRHLQTILLFFGLTVAYAMRVNLSVAIVAMTDDDRPNENVDYFMWRESTQSLVLSSFFWGYVVTQIPAGQLVEKYGAKMLLLVALTICATLNILIPLCASYGGWKLVCALRVCQGLCQGFVFPSTHTLLSKWAPVSERAKLCTYAYAGTQFGTVAMMGFSGILASSTMGWPSIFYISGFAGLVWAVVWFIFAGNSPNESKSISPEERAYIMDAQESKNLEHADKKISTPWVAIFTSVPFLVLTLVHSTHNWGFWTLLTEMPTYFKHVMKLDIKNNALLSALPYLAMCILSFVFSFINEALSKNKCISIRVSRKLFNSIGHWIPMIALIGLGYVNQGSTELAVTLLTLAVGLNAATYLGFQCNHIDLAPNHAGTLMGITNCSANIMSIIAPLLVGFIVNDNNEALQWRTVFLISAGVYFVGNLFFIIFGKTSVQKWNESLEVKDDAERNSTHRTE